VTQYKSLSSCFSAQPVGLGADLPINVQLLSLEFLEDARDGKKVVVRLAHQFAVNEDESLSANVEIDLAELFSTFGAITSVAEMSLSMNQLKSELVNNKIAWKTMHASSEPNNGSSTSASRSLRARDTKTDTVVSLSPMQIRSFIVTFSM
jgi:hypothetical protein